MATFAMNAHGGTPGSWRNIKQLRTGPVRERRDEMAAVLRQAAMWASDWRKLQTAWMR